MAISMRCLFRGGFYDGRQPSGSKDGHYWGWVFFMTPPKGLKRWSCVVSTVEWRDTGIKHQT